MPDAERKKWQAIHAERGFFPREPSTVITALERFLPHTPATALDVAGGTGRHAFWLAERGFEPTLVDISSTAIHIAQTEAASRGIQLSTVSADLVSAPLPPGPWHLIVCFHYLHRPLVAQFADGLAPGGVLVMVQPTVRNLERHPRPGRRFLLEEDELPDLAAAANLGVVDYQEDWSHEGRHEAALVARRPPET